MSDPDRDGARDAWLSQALRHAPDSDAAAPPALSAAILAQARAATARPRPFPARPEGRTLVELLRSWWIALARPPVAAAFASVMAATLVGLMWWDRPMDETLPRPPVPAARSVPATPAPTPAAPATEQARAPATDPVPAPAPVEAESNAPPPVLGRDAKRAPAVSGRVAVPPLAPKPESAKAFPAPEARGGVERDRLQEAKKDTEPSAFAGAAAPAATTAPSPADAARAPAPAAAPATPLDAGRGKAQARNEIAADRADKSMARSAAPAREPQPAGMAAPRQRSAADARENADALERERPALVASPLASLLDSIAREPQRWTRQAGVGSAAEIEPLWRAWLAEVDGAAAGRWQTSGASAASADHEGRDAASLQLFLDGRAAAILRLDGRTVRLGKLLSNPPEHWQASLAPAAASRLAAGRARLPP